MDVEIIISSDNPKVNIDAFRDIDKLSRIYTINATENGGYSVACNKAAQMAKGELLILMDSDIFVTDGWLNALEEVYKSKPSSSIILSIRNYDISTAIFLSLGNLNFIYSRIIFFFGVFKTYSFEIYPSIFFPI